MPIQNRDLPSGAILTARFKGDLHKVLVVGDSGTGLGFELDGGTIYRSLSAAGSAVMGGTACNGWRFWSLEGEEPPAKEPRPAKAPKEPRSPKAKTPRPKPNGSTEDYRKWTDERLTALVESTRRALARPVPALRRRAPRAVGAASEKLS